MSRTTILVSESAGFSERAEAVLRQVGDVVLADLDRSQLLQAVGSADVLWVRLRHHIDKPVLDAAPQLRVLVTPTTGLNHVAVDDVRRRRIQILSLQTEAEYLKNIRATAEHTLALMFAVMRRIPAALQHVRAGHWDRDQFKGHELYGKTVGIVGYGRLGRIVARYLQALDVEVVASDPHVAQQDVDPHVRLCALDELLRIADVVTLHASYSRNTHAFFGAREFGAMKQGAWFINTARGELVDEDALVAALRSGHLNGAAVDVVANEQGGSIADNELVAFARKHDSLLVTPHIGGCTVESMEATEFIMAQRLRDVLSDVLWEGGS